MSADIRRRFRFATELRQFAEQVEALELASRIDLEAPIAAKLDLARSMRAQAVEVMKHEDPPEGVATVGRARSAVGNRSGPSCATGRLGRLNSRRPRRVDLSRTTG